MVSRKKTSKIKLGNIYIGGDAPISIQSMTNTDTKNIDATIGQIKELEKVGCDIVRIAVPNMKAARVVDKIKANISIPLVADIHFDYRLALESIIRGVDGLRLNPGNITRRDKVETIVKEARSRDIPIRIGVNGGSVDRNKYPILSAESLVNSAINHIKILEDLNYHNIKVSLKATSVPMTIDSYLLMSKLRNYPLHIGVTEAGTMFRGTIKSSIGIGTLLAMGIGDTLRVSLTADPIEEVRVAKQILESLDIRKEGLELISCPTCGRCDIDLIGLANKVDKEVGHIKKPIKVAVMGCIVNGPGESKGADIGIAGGKGTGVLFKNGKEVKRVKEEDLLTALVEEVKRFE